MTKKARTRLIPLDYHIRWGGEFAEEYVPPRIRVPYSVHFMRHLEKQLRRRGVGCIWRADGAWYERNSPIYFCWAATLGKFSGRGMWRESEIVFSVGTPLLTVEEMGSKV